MSVSARPADGRRGRGGPGAAAALERAGTFLRALAGKALRLGAVAALGGAATWWALYVAIEPGDLRAAVLVLSALLLALPPTALALFAVAARTLLALPERIRQAPGAIRDRAGEISSRAGQVAEARRGGLLRGIPAVARLWWSVASAKELLELASPATVLLRSATLIAALIALPAAILEVLLGAAALLWLAM